MNLIERYFSAFQKNSNNIAFCQEEKCYNYSDFLESVNGIRMLFESQTGFKPKTAIGVYCNEQMETYAAVFAIWFAGCYFVPLQKNAPKQFNESIIRKHKIKHLLNPAKSNVDLSIKDIEFLNITGVRNAEVKDPFKWKEDQILYVLNTSGSTGTPKNVPVNLRNLDTFVEGFLELFPELDESDNFLQTYELTADAAFTGYLIPLLIGASVYTCPGHLFKPFAVAKVLKEKPITWTQVTPSLLACLHPFFDSLSNKNIKHFHFGGEALPLGLVEKWRECVPNAEISNVYGPTETTITTSIYKCLPGKKMEAHNNTVSIGKPLKSVDYIIQPGDSQKENTGELFIGGNQVMDKYLFTNSQPFKFFDEETEKEKFYPTGDIVHKDRRGNYYFLERKDNQVKINGYRVDLIEIENAVREIIGSVNNIAVVPVEESPGLKKLVVFIENFREPVEIILARLSEKLQDFKVPERIITVPVFPLSTSGKTDKKMLVANFYKQER